MKLFHEEDKGWSQRQQGQGGNLQESVTVPQRQTHMTSELLPLTREDNTSLHHCRAGSGQVTPAYHPVGGGREELELQTPGPRGPSFRCSMLPGALQGVGSMRPTGYLAVWEGVLGVDGRAAGCSKCT